MLANSKHVTRKTTDAIIGPEASIAIRDWLLECHQTDPQHREPYLFIDCEEPLNKFLSRTAKLHHNDNLRLRLSHDDLEALGNQFRFWESCMDVLHPKFREKAPNPAYFQSAALEIEGALWLTFHDRPEPASKPNCDACGQPVTDGGSGEVDIDLTTKFWHHGCRH